jgi:alpha-beta hydrolase superfamily lysophospholipase
VGREIHDVAGWLVAAILVVVAATAPASASGRAVTLPSSGGVTLAAELFEPAGRPAPGVVLVHMLTRSKSEWGSLGDRLQDAGLTALAIDLRGHGNSTGSPTALPDMVQDVRAAVTWLGSRPGVRSGSIALVGASLGATLSVLAAGDLPQVRALALLSPSLDYRGLRADASLLARLGARPIWMAASTEDPLALRTLREYAAEPSGPREQHLIDRLAHGTGLVGAEPDLARSLVDWLRRTLLS